MANPAKRESERRGHRTAAELAARAPDVAPGAPVVVTPAPNGNWHTVAKQWFTSLADSGQSRFFEPSDWAVAAYVAEAMSRSLRKASGAFPAALFTAVLGATGELLSTEGSRRRLRLELTRPGPTAVPASVQALDDYRRTVGG
jgi:hypothetical protein